MLAMAIAGTAGESGSTGRAAENRSGRLFDLRVCQRPHCGFRVRDATGPGFADSGTAERPTLAIRDHRVRTENPRALPVGHKSIQLSLTDPPDGEELKSLPNGIHGSAAIGLREDGVCSLVSAWARSSPMVAATNLSPA